MQVLKTKGSVEKKAMAKLMTFEFSHLHGSVKIAKDRKK